MPFISFTTLSQPANFPVVGSSTPFTRITRPGNGNLFLIDTTSRNLTYGPPLLVNQIATLILRVSNYFSASSIVTMNFTRPNGTSYSVNNVAFVGSSPLIASNALNNVVIFPALQYIVYTFARWELSPRGIWTLQMLVGTDKLAPAIQFQVFPLSF